MKESLHIDKSTARPKNEDYLVTAEKALVEAVDIEIKPEDRNEKGELLVTPNGAVSELGKMNEFWWKVARTDAFKKFFGNWQDKGSEFSEMVDKNGEPLVLFRGRAENRDFGQGPKDNYALGDGIYFTTHPHVAHAYAIEGGTKFPVFLNVRNPKIFYSPEQKSEYDAVLKDFGEKKGWLFEVMVNDLSQIMIIPNSTKSPEDIFWDYTKGKTRQIFKGDTHEWDFQKGAD